MMTSLQLSQGRNDLFEYASKNNIPLPVDK